MLPKNKKSSSGFTLIELLVTISVIGFLATVAFAYYNSAQERARNAKRLADIRQYSKVFDLAFDKNGEYPDPGTTNWRCLGDFSDDKCWRWGTNYSENPTLNAILDDFLPALPVNEGTVCGSDGWEGALYRCAIRTSGICSRYQVIWFMEGTSQSCAGETTWSNNFQGRGCTYCYMTQSL